MDKATAVRGNPAFRFSDSLTYPNSAQEKARFLQPLPTHASIVAKTRKFNVFFQDSPKSAFLKSSHFVLFLATALSLAPSS